MSGRTLSGVVLKYGDVSPTHRERFMAGAFGPELRAPLNVQHDPGMVILEAGEFVLTDSRMTLEIRAELPPESAALKLVKRGALNGYSVEFNAVAESRMGDVRVIERADLVGIGLVDVPSYPASVAEVRAEHRVSIGTLSGSIRSNANWIVRVRLGCAGWPTSRRMHLTKYPNVSAIFWPSRANTAVRSAAAIEAACD